MSGRLIILPKKRWNVWNRENIAKVRYDEQQHQLKVEKEEDRQRKLDSEARLQVLRKRSKGADASDEPQLDFKVKVEDDEGEVSIHTASGHINFFQDIEHAMDGNEEHEVCSLVRSS